MGELTAGILGMLLGGAVMLSAIYLIFYFQGNMMIEYLKGKKTYVVAAVAVVTAVGAYLTGETGLATMIEACFGAIMFATVRSGIKTEAGK